MADADTDLEKPEEQGPGGREPEIGLGCKTRLPGLTLVFFIGLCAGGVLCGLCAFWALRVLTQSATWHFGIEYIFMGLAAAGVLGAGLSGWVGYGIYERMEGAPRRCRMLLAINIAAAAVGIAGMGALFLIFGPREDSALGFLTRNNTITTISNLLAAIVISEAWRRYFLLSPKVRRTFGLYQPPGCAAELPPAEIALFTVVCWLCPVHYGLPKLIWLAYSFSTVTDGGLAFIALHAAITVSCLVLPFAALYALRVRRGMLRVIFWCLGLWLALEAAVWAANIITLYISLAEQGGYQYTYGLPRLFSERLFIPLAFWWYFAVSAEARSWFSATELPWEEKAVRL